MLEFVERGVRMLMGVSCCSTLPGAHVSACESKTDTCKNSGASERCTFDDLYLASQNFGSHDVSLVMIWSKNCPPCTSPSPLTGVALREMQPHELNVATARKVQSEAVEESKM